jgi:hypothetical protein
MVAVQHLCLLLLFSLIEITEVKPLKFCMMKDMYKFKVTHFCVLKITNMVVRLSLKIFQVGW